MVCGRMLWAKQTKLLTIESKTVLANLVTHQQLKQFCVSILIISNCWFQIITLVFISFSLYIELKVTRSYKHLISNYMYNDLGYCHATPRPSVH